MYNISNKKDASERVDLFRKEACCVSKGYNSKRVEQRANHDNIEFQ
jgi:hypothetical protein